MEPYRYLYPFDEDDVMRTAYDFDYRDGRDPRTYAGSVIDRVNRWSRQGAVGGLGSAHAPTGRS
jgi:hypothetical protein